MGNHGDASGTNKLALFWEHANYWDASSMCSRSSPGPGPSGKEGGREGEEKRRGGGKEGKLTFCWVPRLFPRPLDQIFCNTFSFSVAFLNHRDIEAYQE